jgi:hypothetical protein
VELRADSQYLDEGQRKQVVASWRSRSRPISASVRKCTCSRAGAEALEGKACHVYDKRMAS